MRLCAFCPSPATKKGEHIFDDWLNYDEDGRFVGRSYLVESDGRYEADSLSYQSRNINITRPVVCAKCNNEWMSDISNYTKQITEGMIRHARPVTVIPLGIVTLAAFAVMKAMVVDYSITLDGHRPFFGLSTRYRFREETIFPDGVQIWMARPEIHGNPLASGHAWSSTLQLYSGIVKGFHFYLFTYWVGHLVIQLTCPKWGQPNSRRPNELPVLQEAIGWRQYTVPIWPDSFDAYWPPPLQLERERLQTFRDRFRNLQAPVRRPTR